jgi:hypothetical protein
MDFKNGRHARMRPRPTMNAQRLCGGAGGCAIAACAMIAFAQAIIGASAARPVT